MKTAANLLTALMVLAIAQTLTKALCIVLLIFTLMGAVTMPRQTFALIAALGLLTLAQQKPAYCIAALGTIGIAAVITGRAGPRVASSTPLLLEHKP
jgi:hypothetical protein